MVARGVGRPEGAIAQIPTDSLEHREIGAGPGNVSTNVAEVHMGITYVA